MVETIEDKADFITVTFGNSVAENLAVALAVFWDVRITQPDSETNNFVNETEMFARSKWTLESISNDVLFQSYRKLWWNYGMDPTKLRPSAEAMIRRVLSDKPLYRINNLVDTLNAVSIKYALSMGYCDFDKIKGNLAVRKADNGEQFKPIGTKSDYMCNGTELVVADEEKIIDLGFSTSSSDSIKITNNTKNFLLLIYAPEEIDVEYGEDAMEAGIDAVKKFCQGKLLKKDIFRKGY